MTTVTSSVPFPAPSVARVKMNTKPRPGKMPPGTASKFVPGQVPPSLQNRLASKTRPNQLSPTPPTSASEFGINGVSSASKLNERRKAAARAVDGGAPARPIGRPKKNAATNGVDGSSAGLNSPTASPILQKAKPSPLPLVLTTEYILKKYKNVPPSLVIHLHPTHFRFAGQDGGFSYSSPMKLFLEALKTETIPQEFTEIMNDLGVKYYEGRLIVQVHDHRIKGEAAKIEERKEDQFKLGSLNSSTQYLTPSPFVAFQDFLQKPLQKSKHSNMNSTAKSEAEKENKKREVRIFTTVLHPSTSTLQLDIAGATMPAGPAGRGALGSKPSTPTSALGGSFSRVQTPLSAQFPKSAQSRQKLSDTAAAQLEAQTLVLGSGSLILTPATCPEHAAKILDALRDPLHSAPPPKPKTRKRTNAELAADEALAAEEERLLLIMDERRHPGVTAGTSAQGPRSALPDDSEPQLKRFKLMTEIRNKIESKKKETEKAQRAKSISETKTAVRAEIAREKVLERQAAHATDRENARLQEQMDLQRQRQQAAANQMPQPPMLVKPGTPSLPQGSPALPTTQAPKPPPVQTSVAPKQNVPPPKTPMTPLQAQTPVTQPMNAPVPPQTQAPSVSATGTPQMPKATRPPTPAQPLSATPTPAQLKSYQNQAAARAHAQALAAASASRVASPALSAAAVPMAVSTSSNGIATSSPVVSAIPMSRARTFGSNQGVAVNGMPGVRPSFSPQPNAQNLPGQPQAGQQMTQEQQMRMIQAQRMQQARALQMGMGGQGMAPQPNAMGMMRPGMPQNVAQAQHLQAQQQQRNAMVIQQATQAAQQQAMQNPQFAHLPPEQKQLMIRQLTNQHLERFRMNQAARQQQIAQAQQQQMQQQHMQQQMNLAAAGQNPNMAAMAQFQQQQQQMMNGAQMNGAKANAAAQRANMLIAANARQGPGGMMRMTPAQMQQAQGMQQAQMGQFQDMNGFALNPNGRGVPMNGVNGMGGMNGMMGMNMGMGMPMGRGGGGQN